MRFSVVFAAVCVLTACPAWSQEFTVLGGAMTDSQTNDRFARLAARIPGRPG